MGDTDDGLSPDPPTVNAAANALVLVADDDGDILTLVALQLKRAGYDVLEAADGEAALQLALERLPALAILDISMPKRTGDEVTRALRRNESTRAMPIILLTARVQEIDVERGLAAGATEYVTKPFSPQDLNARVEALIRR